MKLINLILITANQILIFILITSILITLKILILNFEVIISGCNLIFEVVIRCDLVLIGLLGDLESIDHVLIVVVEYQIVDL